MAIHISPVALTLPEAGVYFEPAAVNLQANDRYPGMVLAFPSQTLRQGCGFHVRIPNNYVGTPVLQLLGATTATTGAVVWDLVYQSIASGESIDPSTDQESLTVTTTVPGTARLLFTSSISLTAANLDAGDILIGTVYRDGADAADTLAATAWIVSAVLSYADA